jgi:integrase
MTSITTRKTGSRFIRFDDEDGMTQTISIGRTPQRVAETICRHVEVLASSRAMSSSISRDTALWVTTIGDNLHGKLARVGLVEPRQRATLGNLIESFIRSRDDVKPSTRLVYKRAKKHLLAHFGENRRLDAITKADAHEWRHYMLRYGLAEATTRKATSIARQMFREAIRRGLVEINPFDGLPATVGGSTDRLRFIARDDMSKVLAACPCNQWKAIFALARFGGLRCPSEVLSLKWEHVNWEKDRLTIPSPKTADQGKASRIIPLFAEVRNALLTVFEEAEPGAERIITRYRPGANLGVHAARIIQRAGLKVWPKVFQNLRASFATELVEQLPTHVAADWCGHTQAVAQKHYLQVTDEHFDQTIEGAHIRAHMKVHDGLRNKEKRELTDSYATNETSGSYMKKQVPAGSAETCSSGPGRT